MLDEELLETELVTVRRAKDEYSQIEILGVEVEAERRTRCVARTDLGEKNKENSRSSSDTVAFVS